MRRTHGVPFTDTQCGFKAVRADVARVLVGAGAPLLARPALLAVGLVGTAAWGAVVVARNPAWFGWTGWLGLGLATVASVLLLVRRGSGPQQGHPAAVGREEGHPAAVRARVATVLGLVAVLLTPAVWSGAAAVLPSFAFLGPATAPGGLFGAAGPLRLRGTLTASRGCSAAYGAMRRSSGSRRCSTSRRITSEVVVRSTPSMASS